MRDVFPCGISNRHLPRRDLRTTCSPIQPSAPDWVIVENRLLEQVLDFVRNLFRRFGHRLKPLWHRNVLVGDATAPIHFGFRTSRQLDVTDISGSIASKLRPGSLRVADPALMARTTLPQTPFGRRDWQSPRRRHNPVHCAIVAVQPIGWYCSCRSTSSRRLKL